MILPAFLALVNPVSTIANPACIKNTKAAPIKNQMLNTSVPTALVIAVNISPVIIISSSHAPESKMHPRGPWDAHLCTNSGFTMKLNKRKSASYLLYESAFAFMGNSLHLRKPDVKEICRFFISENLSEFRQHSFTFSAI